MYSFFDTNAFGNCITKLETFNVPACKKWILKLCLICYPYYFCCCCLAKKPVIHLSA